MRQEAKELTWTALFLVLCTLVGTLLAAVIVVLAVSLLGWLL